MRIKLLKYEAILNLRQFICTFLIVSQAISVFPQTSPVLKHINRADGLTSNRVNDITQDRYGFIWIATENGLNRYDGLDFKQYNAKSSKFEITKLFVDGAGNLWVFSLGGGIFLYRYQQDDFEYLSPSEVGGFNAVNVIHEDPAGTLWVGTDKGLYSFDPVKKDSTNNLTLHKYASSSGSNVTDVVPDNQGNLWISTFGEGLRWFDTETGKIQAPWAGTPSNHIGFNFIYDMEYLDSVNLILGTSGSGLLVYNTTSHSIRPYPLQHCLDQDGIVRTILKDTKDQLWIGTDGNGLVKIEDRASQYPVISCFQKQNGIPNTISGNAIYRVFEDNVKNIWIGTAWNGINILPSELEGVEMVSIGEENHPVLCINSISDRLWFGTDGYGLSHNSAKSLSIWEKEMVSLVENTYVQCIYQDTKGSVWIGTFASGLLKYDTTSRRSMWITTDRNKSLSLPINDIRGILEDSLGNYWVATAGGGLNYINLKADKVTSFRHHDNNPCSLGNDNIQSFIMNEDGTLWLATHGGGLDYYNPESGCFEHFNFDSGDPGTINSNHLSSLLNDGLGNLWIGTRDGLCKMDVNTREIHRIKGNGLSYGLVTSILTDNNGDIWVSTRSGIYKYDVNSDRFWHLTQLNEEYHLNASYKKKDGKLLFGGIMGVTSYDPEKLFKVGKVELPIQITDLQLFNKSINTYNSTLQAISTTIGDSDLTFEYHESVITFDFSALYYPSSSKIEYSVKMDNFDQDWRSIGHQRSATYTNLSPGEYQFKVRANLPGADFSESSPVDIVILAPIWKRWWAYALYTIIFMVVLWMIIRYTQVLEKMRGDLKVEKLKREQETHLHNIKQRFFTNISHEIRTPVTLLLGAVNSMTKGVDHNHEDLQKFSVIKNNGKRLLKLVNELLDLRKLERNRVTLKVERVNLVSFTHDIFLSFNHRANHRNIDYQFISRDDEVLVWLDKDEMEKVLYNLLSNAFKHSPGGGKITVVLQELESAVELSVSDTGKGIPTQDLSKVFQRFYHIGIDNDSFSKDGFGLGLAITHEIVNLHGGEISVASTSGKGSKFCVTLLKGNAHFPENSIIQDSEAAVEDLYHLEKREYPQSMISNLKGSQLLIVDDNSEIRDYLKELLDYDFEIKLAENGNQAWEMAMNELPDLVISDVVMPELDGIAFTKALKENPKTSHIPIILLTARTSDDYHLYGLEIGADDFITKPFDEDLLKARVINLLKNRFLVKEKIKNELILNPKEITVSSPDQEFLADLISILDANIGIREFNVSNLSKSLGMSHSIIYKKIKALTGYNLVEFIRDYRLKKAAKLLTNEDISVKEACYAVGFSDRKYFGAIFKKKFGTSPSHYRKNPSRKTDIPRIS